MHLILFKNEGHSERSPLPSTLLVYSHLHMWVTIDALTVEALVYDEISFRGSGNSVLISIIRCESSDGGVATNFLQFPRDVPNLLH